MDIDIDFKTTFDVKQVFPNAVVASRVFDGKLLKHPAGAYFQNVAVDPITNLSAVPFKTAEQLGLFKIDFLHLSLLDDFQSKEEIKMLLTREPDWNLLQSPSVVSQLFQIHQHYDTIIQIKPKSVDDLADCIAIIRPTKKLLLPKYIEAKHDAEQKRKIRNILYMKPANDAMWFKKAHSIAYAMTIVLQLHKIKQEGNLDETGTDIISQCQDDEVTRTTTDQYFKF